MVAGRVVVVRAAAGFARTVVDGTVGAGATVVLAARVTLAETIEVVVVDVVVEVVVVDVVVVVEVVVVDEGIGAPVIRGGPINSKCMPSGMLHVPPHAKPLRRKM